MRRIRFTLAYDGTDFHGWQVQPGLVTIQGTLQEILARLEGAPVIVHGSGRTDAGVHALAQVAACTMANPLPLDNLRKALNHFLPLPIRVLAVDEAPPDFQPRFDAIAKTYEYRIAREEICSPFERRYVHHFPYPLNEAAFIQAAPAFAGEHDFSTFAAADTRDELDYSKVRTIFSSQAFLEGTRLIYRVRGTGFLKHMVRNLVGTLIEVGKGNHQPSDIAALIASRDRSQAGATAPASGLFLVNVEYPDYFNSPDNRLATGDC
jgi:tRNA pseudouridine38-40 synthase